MTPSRDYEMYGPEDRPEIITGSMVVMAIAQVAFIGAIELGRKVRDTAQTAGTKLADLGDIFFQGEVTDRKR